MVIAFGKSTEFQEKPRIYKSACEAYKDAPWVFWQAVLKQIEDRMEQEGT